MKNKYHFLIKDARGGFRVQQIAGNGEILNTSQVLDTVDAVYKNIIAARCAGNILLREQISDLKSQKKRLFHIQEKIRYGIFVLVYEGKKSQVLKDLFQ